MRKFLLVLLLFLSTQAFANVFEHEESLSVISEKLPKLNDISCKFSQEKIIPNSNIVLKSSGDFVFEKQNGAVFYTKYPIKSTSSYTTREYRQINNIITSISNKNYKRLEKDFKFYYQDGWTFGLVPKQSSQAFNYLKSIEICGTGVNGGNDRITKLVILTTDNTKTTIKFVL